MTDASQSIRPLHVVTIDDEPLALRRLQVVLGETPNVLLAGAGRTVEEGVELARRHRPDVVLLDIDLGGRSGFELLPTLREIGARVILVSAFGKFAIEAFEHEAIDYLLKPVTRDRLRLALDRARARLNADEEVAELGRLVARLQSEAVAVDTDRHEAEFWVRRGTGERQRIAVDRIYKAQAEDDYVRLFVDGRSHLMRETLAGLERRLPPRTFIRLHRSLLVRRSSVLSVGRDPKGYYAVLESGEVLRAGRIYGRALSRSIAGRAT